MCVMFRLGAQESKELISLCTNLTVRLNLISTLHTTLLSMSCKCCSLCSTKGGTHVENKGVTCDEDEGVSLVQTVRGNYEGYTKQEVLKAKEARRAQAAMRASSREAPGEGGPERVSDAERAGNLQRVQQRLEPELTDARDLVALFGEDDWKPELTEFWVTFN